MEELRHRLYDNQQENKNPNIAVEPAPTVLVRYDLTCIVDEDWLEVLLKADSTYLDPSAITRLLSSKDYQSIKEEFVNQLH